MFDLKDTPVFMYKAAKHGYILLRGMVLEKSCNKNCKRKFCSVRTLFTNVTLPYMSHTKILRKSETQLMLFSNKYRIEI